MTRTHYRLLLSAVCGLAAWVGPVVFLEDRLKAGYLIGGVVAALLAWAFLSLGVLAEPNLSPLMQGAIGAGTAVLSWTTISLVTLFDVTPQVVARGMDPFDPVWFMGGLAPLIVPAVAWWWARAGRPIWQALCTALFRFSVPLFALQLLAQLIGLPKQYRWLFLFTGVMFLVLDGLGAEREPREV